MSKQRSGFTLVELLAVIVILAVIAVIATPAVLNIIEDSKKAAAEASARNIVSAAKSYYMQNLMDNKPNSNVDLSTNTLKYDGEQAKKGLLSYDANGNVSGKMYISGYCVEVASDGNVTSEKVSIDDCNIADISTGGNTSGGNQGGNESGSGSESGGSETISDKYWNSDTPEALQWWVQDTIYFSPNSTEDFLSIQHGQNGNMFKLLKDYDISGEELIIPSNVTLDLLGHNLYVNKLTVYSGAKIVNGQIKINDSADVYGSVTMENVDLKDAG